MELCAKAHTLKPCTPGTAGTFLLASPAPAASDKNCSCVSVCIYLLMARPPCSSQLCSSGGVSHLSTEQTRDFDYSAKLVLSTHCWSYLCSASPIPTIPKGAAPKHPSCPFVSIAVPAEGMRTEAGSKGSTRTSRECVAGLGTAPGRSPARLTWPRPGGSTARGLLRTGQAGLQTQQDLSCTRAVTSWQARSLGTAIFVACLETKLLKFLLL